MRRSVYDEIERRMAEARHAARKAEQQRRAFVRWRAELASLSASLALIRLGHALARKYRPDQPRVPAGRPGAGQWTNGGGLGEIVGRKPDAKPGDSAKDGRIVVAGGFEPDQLDLTVQKFVAQNCKGSVNRRIPGQFAGSTIRDVMAAADAGDADARACLKILSQDRFRK